MMPSDGSKMMMYTMMVCITDDEEDACSRAIEVLLYLSKRWCPINKSFPLIVAFDDLISSRRKAHFELWVPLLPRPISTIGSFYERKRGRSMLVELFPVCISACC